MRSYAILCMACATLPCATRAQLLPHLQDPTREADLLYFAGHPLEALDLLEEHLDAHPNDYEALWRAARSGVVLGMEEEGSRRQNGRFDPAMAFGDRAVEVRPEGIDGLYWRGAAYGRRAMNANAGYAVELIQTVFDSAHEILELDPGHGGAHNLLGKLNYEVMAISRFERALGRLLMGNRAIRAANWDDAELHLRRATELWPDVVVFRLDLAQLYRKRGRIEEARTVLRDLVRLSPLHPPDGALQQEALKALEELAGS